MFARGARELVGMMQEEVCGHVTIDDADIEIIEIILENPWGADSCPPHMHVWHELNYVFEGTLKTGFGGPMLEVGPGDFYVIPPGVEHSHEYVAHAPHLGVCLRWMVKPAGGEDVEPRGGGVFELLNGLRNWQPGCYPDRYSLGEQLLRLFREAEERCAPASIRLTVVKFLLSLAAVRAPQGRIADGSSLANTNFLRKIEIYLNDAQALKMDVHRLAGSLHMSYNHLARKYKQLTGKTVLGRLTEIRLARAAELLQRTDETISAIAEKSGFASVYYFSRVFKIALGVSPREYRKSGG